MQRRHAIPAAAVLLLMLAAGAFWWLGQRAPTLRESVPIAHFTLKNGMTVVVMPNDRIPEIAHILFVRSGAADDPYGKSGLAHYLEHLMFTGTKKYPEGVFDHKVARAGGEENAYTTRDFTAFYVVIAKDQLASVMEMEADRLGNLALDPARAAREHKVITEERNMRVENSAEALLAEQLDAITFLNHPYHQPLIGWAEDMASLNLNDARAFYQKNYVASNLVLVVAGDVTPHEVERLAEHSYGGLPARAAPKRDWPKEPPIRLVLHASMTDDKANEPRLVRQYVAPSLVDGKTDEAMPLALYAQYLGGDQTSLLYQTLVVQQKVASAIDCDYDALSVGPALLRIEAVPAPGVSLETLEAALDAALNAALAVPPPADDVTRAKTQLKAELVFAQDGLAPLAHLVGSLYMLGKNEEFFYAWPQLVETATPESMLAAAKDTLNSGHRVTGYLNPLHPGAAAAVPILHKEDTNVR